jgi:hypothetical protein
MFDGPATFGATLIPAWLAADISAERSGSPSGSANGGQQVVTSMDVGRVPGHAASTPAAVDCSKASASRSSRAGVRRTSTLRAHRSATVE